MITYVWICKKCETLYETERKMEDRDIPPEEPCECGGELVRGLSAPKLIGPKHKGDWGKV